jgi:hypothetical protein
MEDRGKDIRAASFCNWSLAVPPASFEDHNPIGNEMSASVRDFGYSA